jgi:hypothetical protein
MERYGPNENGMLDPQLSLPAVADEEFRSLDAILFFHISAKLLPDSPPDDGKRPGHGNCEPWLETTIGLGQEAL